MRKRCRHKEIGRRLVEAWTDADLIIVGSGRLNRLQRLLLGSVSAKVVRDAASTF